MLDPSAQSASRNRTATGMGRYWPFYLACVALLMLVTFVPALSLWLPSLMK